MCINTLATFFTSDFVLKLLFRPCGFKKLTWSTSAFKQTHMISLTVAKSCATAGQTVQWYNSNLVVLHVHHCSYDWNTPWCTKRNAVKGLQVDRPTSPSASEKHARLTYRDGASMSCWSGKVQIEPLVFTFECSDSGKKQDLKVSSEHIRYLFKPTETWWNVFKNSTFKKNI